jgi:hypothetical protein
MSPGQAGAFFLGGIERGEATLAGLAGLAAERVKGWALSDQRGAGCLHEIVGLSIAPA